MKTLVVLSADMLAPPLVMMLGKSLAYQLENQKVQDSVSMKELVLDWWSVKTSVLMSADL